MTSGKTISLDFRSADTTTRRMIEPTKCACVLSDAWDRHWCRGANERLAKLLPGINALFAAARDAGMLVVHAPSDVTEFYADSPARKRAIDAPDVEPPPEIAHDDPPLPIDDSDGGCDTDNNDGKVNDRVWTRQHRDIVIDEVRDVISDNGRELCNVYRQRGINTLFVLGVHTNMCVLDRSFAIKQMVKWGFGVALVRDLTDSMYNPSMPPRVTHEEGTELVVRHIEKHWCPSVTSSDMIAALSA